MSTPSGDFCTAIGRIAAATASIDFDLGRILVDLNNGRGMSHIVSGQSYSFIDNALRAVADQLVDADAIQLRALRDSVKEPHRRRDLVIHGIWFPADIDAHARGEANTDHFAFRSRW